MMSESQRNTLIMDGAFQARRRQDATRKAYATGCQEQEAQKWQGSEGLV